MELAKKVRRQVNSCTLNSESCDRCWCKTSFQGLRGKDFSSIHGGRRNSFSAGNAPRHPQQHESPDSHKNPYTNRNMSLNELGNRFDGEQSLSEGVCVATTGDMVDRPDKIESQMLHYYGEPRNVPNDPGRYQTSEEITAFMSEVKAFMERLAKSHASTLNDGYTGELMNLRSEISSLRESIQQNSGVNFGDIVDVYKQEILDLKNDIKSIKGDIQNILGTKTSYHSNGEYKGEINEIKDVVNEIKGQLTGIFLTHDSYSIDHYKKEISGIEDNIRYLKGDTKTIQELIRGLDLDERDRSEMNELRREVTELRNELKEDIKLIKEYMLKNQCAHDSSPIGENERRFQHFEDCFNYIKTDIAHILQQLGGRDPTSCIRSEHGDDIAKLSECPGEHRKLPDKDLNNGSERERPDNNTTIEVDTGSAATECTQQFTILQSVDSCDIDAHERTEHERPISEDEEDVVEHRKFSDEDMSEEIHSIPIESAESCTIISDGHNPDEEDDLNEEECPCVTSSDVFCGSLELCNVFVSDVGISEVSKRVFERFKRLVRGCEGRVPVSMLGTFALCRNLKEVTFDEDLPIGSVRNFSRMFMNCTSLERVSFKGSMHSEALGDECLFTESMFEGCSVLNEVYLPVDFPFENVVNSNAMFRDCGQLTVVHNLGLSPLTSHEMFRGCSSIVKLAFKNQISMETDIYRIFASCHKLRTVELRIKDLNSRTHDDPSLQHVHRGLFEGCQNVEEISIQPEETRVFLAQKGILPAWD